MNFDKIEKIIERIIANCDSKYIIMQKKRKNIDYKINIPGYIKLYFRKELDSSMKSSFYVLYMIEVNDPDKNVIFDDDFYWQNNHNIRRIVKLSSLKNHGTVIRSITHELGLFDIVKDTYDNIIIIPDENDIGLLYKKGLARIVPLKDITNAISSMNLNKFFNDFEVKKR